MKKDSYVYALKNFSEIAYYGITDDRGKRMIEHATYAKEFYRFDTLAGPMAQEKAEQMKHDLILQFQLEHGGDPPKYNKGKITTPRTKRRR